MGKGLFTMQMETGTLESSKMVSDSEKALFTKQEAERRQENTKTVNKLSNWSNWCREELCCLVYKATSIVKLFYCIYFIWQMASLIEFKIFRL